MSYGDYDDPQNRHSHLSQHFTNFFPLLITAYLCAASLYLYLNTALLALLAVGHRHSLSPRTCSLSVLNWKTWHLTRASASQGRASTVNTCRHLLH